MKKYNVMGHEMAKMDDVKWCIRKARKDIDDLYENKGEDAKKLAHTILDDVIRMSLRLLRLTKIVMPFLR